MIRKMISGEEIFSTMNQNGNFYKAININLFVMTLIGLLCDACTWLWWLRDLFPNYITETFLWYVIYPSIGQLVVLAVSIIVCGAFEKKLSDSRKVIENKAFATIVSVLYSCYVIVYLFFYYDVQQMWVLIILPLLVASFYQKERYMFITTFANLAGVLWLFLSVAPKTLNADYHLSEGPGVMRLAQIIIVFTLLSLVVFTMHSRLNMSISRQVNAEATEKAKDAFFANMSHEIRTPINAILGMNEMILRENISKDVEEYSVNIRSAGQNLLSIVNDILDSSKMDAGKLEIMPVEYDISSILNDCYNMVNVRAKDKGLELRIVNDPSIPKTLKGDEVRIRQVLINLLTNAVKYTKEGFVELNIRWRKLEEDNMLMIASVKDSGVGISVEEQARLFESFERLDEKKNKYIEGTGLGLNIAKQLVELMGGSIEVSSVVGEGSVFTVTIPQKIVGGEALGDFYKGLAARLRPCEVYQEKFQAPDAKILVVDDVQMNIDVFKGLLKRTKMQIDSTTSGQRALDLIRENRYDIIFMDHLMPDMDGIETFNAMKEMNHPNKQTPVIILTANAVVGAEEEYRRIGFDDYLSKPIKSRALEEMIFKLLQNSRLQSMEKSDAKSTEKSEVTTKKEKFLKKVAFLDTVMGLSCCANDVTLYMEILTDFVNNSKIETLRNCYDKMDWGDYREQLQCVKNQTMSIGAVDMSDEVKELETAVAMNDRESMAEKHAVVMRHYEQLIAKIKLALE